MVGTIPVLAQRAASEGPRWTRAVGIIPATPYKVIVRCGLADGLLIIPHARTIEVLKRQYSFPHNHLCHLWHHDLMQKSLRLARNC